MRRPINVPTNPKYIQFIGGMDTVSPQISVNPGTARSSQNVYGDVLSGIYTAMRYERYNGLARPSDASYSILTCLTDGSLVVGDVVLSVAPPTDPFEIYGRGTIVAIETGYLVLTNITGTFRTGNLNKASIIVGTCTGPQSLEGASTPLLNAQYKNLAADYYRALISAVPGSGPGRGLVEFEGIKYAFRDNLLATACDVYKSSASGWTKVELGFELEFTLGGETDNYVPQEGDEIEGVTSGAKATITRVVLESGSWSTPDAAGRFIFASQAGTFQAEKLKVVSGGPYLTVATIAGDSDAITLSPGGKYEFLITNFTGESERRVYGVDGVNYAFEFDGTVFVQIHTGLTSTPDTPTHICELRYRLGLSFGPGTQFSVVATPYQWDLRLGGALLSTGEDVTGYVLQQGQQDTGSLAVFAKNSTNVIYTNNSASVAAWQIIPHKDDTGAVEWTSQRIGNTYFLDDKGIAELGTTQRFGNFRDGIVSDQIKDWFINKKTQVTHSCTFKTKNLYCIFFEDKTAIYGTVAGGKMRDLMPQAFAHKVERVFATENPDGNESVSFIDSDGYVYEMDKGTSFDGEDVSWWFYQAYTHLGSPYVDKRFRRAVAEIQGSGYGSFYLSFSLDYGDNGRIQPPDTLEQVFLEGEYWDSGGFWDQFSFDGTDLEPSDTSIKSRGENISIKLRGGTDYEEPMRFSGVIIQHSMLGRTR